MSIKEIYQPNPRVLFLTMIESIEDNKYAVMTMLMSKAVQIHVRLSEHQMGVEPEKNPDGMFQTGVYVVRDSERGPEIDMTELLAVRRFHFGRPAQIGHDEIVHSLEKEEFDYINDPYYQQVQLEKLQMDLENFNTANLEGE